MFPTGSFGVSNAASRRGASITMEGTPEWRVWEIQYDGSEKYINPKTYADRVKEAAHKVPWQKLVRADADYDVPEQEMSNDEDEDELPEQPSASKEIVKVVPEAGPWHGVAKNMHESLQQLSILLDNLSIMKSTDYMKPLTILDPTLLDSQQVAQEFATTSKTSQWLWKRKALTEAVKVFDAAEHQRDYRQSETSLEHLKDDFFRELKKMREQWRIKKLGDFVVGDLGFHVFGSKYKSRELFDITRACPANSQKAVGNYDDNIIKVSVPKDLNRRSALCVSIVKDDESKNLFETSEDDVEYMRLEECNTDKVRWQDALAWAQESLICREAYSRICKECVRFNDRMIVIRHRVLLVALHDDFLLKIELKFYPFKDVKIATEGIPFLNRTLRQLVVAQQCTRWIRPQMFISLPVTDLAEALDPRGPKAFTKAEIDSRVQHRTKLLDEMINIASHLKLVHLVRQVLQEFTETKPDPHIYWRFLRSSPVNSSFNVAVIHRGFEHVVGKITYYIHVDSTSICVQTRDGHTMACSRDKQQLLFALKYMNCTHSGMAIFTLSKPMFWFQMLHCNSSAVDENGKPAPTFYMLNPSASRALFLQLFTDKKPIIKVRRFVTDGEIGEMQNFTPPEGEMQRFTTLNYDRLLGSTLCKKVENLLLMLRD